MKDLLIVLVLIAALSLATAARARKVVTQYELGVLFGRGRVRRVRGPGLQLVSPFVDVLHRVTIEDVRSAIDRMARTTLRQVAGQHTLDETLSDTDRNGASGWS